jgi:hypothetical protein
MMIRTHFLRFAVIAAVLAVSPLTQSEEASAEAEASEPIPMRTRLNRIGAEYTTWQEPLRLQDVNGVVDSTLVTYRGNLLTIERTLPRTWGGYMFGIFGGAGNASAGSATSSGGSGAGTWLMAAAQPRLYYALAENVNVGASAAAVYRSIKLPSSGSSEMTTSGSVTGIFWLDLDIAFAGRYGFRQSYGFWAKDIGGFWRWGLTIDI